MKKQVIQAHQNGSHNSPRKQAKITKDDPGLSPQKYQVRFGLSRGLLQQVDNVSKARGYDRDAFFEFAVFRFLLDSATGAKLPTRNGESPITWLLKENVTGQEQAAIMSLVSKGLLRIGDGCLNPGLAKMEGPLQSVTTLVHLMENNLEQFLLHSGDKHGERQAAGMVCVNRRTLDDLWAAFDEAWNDQRFIEGLAPESTAATAAASAAAQEVAEVSPKAV